MEFFDESEARGFVLHFSIGSEGDHHPIKISHVLIPPLLVRVSILKRNRICNRIGTTHHQKFLRSKALQRWYSNTCEVHSPHLSIHCHDPTQANKIKRENEFNLLELTFRHWCLFVPQEKTRRRINNGVERKFQEVQSSIQRKLLFRWLRRAKITRRLKILDYQVPYLLSSESHRTRQCLQRVRIRTIRWTYGVWRGEWCKKLLWKEREAKVRLSLSPLPILIAIPW